MSVPANPSTQADEAASSRLCSSSCAYVKQSIREYFLEFSNTDQAASDLRTESAARAIELINKNQVALFVLPGLASAECNKAHQLLADANQLGSADVLEHDAEVLRVIVEGSSSKMAPLPAIFICGRYLGGLDELTEVINNNTIEALKAAIPLQLDLPAEELLTVKPFQGHPLIHQAGGKPFWCFHLFIYGNVVRAVSFLHVLISLVCIVLIANDQYTAAQAITTFLFFDCLLLLWGAAPFSLLGVVSTLLVWPRRGPVVTSLPYKMIFALYAVLLGRLAMETEPFGSVTASSKMNSQAEFVTIAINSSLLAVLRF